MERKLLTGIQLKIPAKNLKFNFVILIFRVKRWKR